MSAAASLSIGSLRLEFLRYQDRLGHVVGLSEEGRFIKVLESIEGDSSEAWPGSPPMQQIVEEQIGPNHSRVLLGVGLSGHGHWSMAVDCPRVQNASSQATNSEVLQLDVACKISKPASQLGSRYRWPSHAIIEKDADSQDNGDRSLEFDIDGHRIRIEVKIGSMSIDLVNKTIALVPDSALTQTMTHRWCYRVELK
jgi:hypothetical protein